MTLREVAARAGVSVSTVSRIINSPDDNFARKSVRDRVWKVIRETGYVPNQSARALKKSRTGSAAERPSDITCIFGRSKTKNENPFFEQVARAIEQQALSLGYTVSCSLSLLDSEKQTEPTKSDGAIVLGRIDEQAQLFLTKRYKNIVYVGRNQIGANWDQVICDGYEASKTALEYLIASGHRRIGYIGETEHEIRYQAFRDTVHAYGLDFDRTLVAACRQDEAGGRQGAQSLLKNVSRLPTAVFCTTDVSAVSAIAHFAEAGLDVPKQISVISMDDIEIAQYASPMLTTVSVPKVEMGNTAVRLLIDRINKMHQLPMRVFLPHKLLVRESTAKLI